MRQNESDPTRFHGENKGLCNRLHYIYNQRHTLDRKGIALSTSIQAYESRLEDKLADAQLTPGVAWLRTTGGRSCK